MTTKDIHEVLAEWRANSDRIDTLRDEFEDKEIAGENYAVTIVPLGVLRAIEKSECAVPALVKAVEAVLALHHVPGECASCRDEPRRNECADCMEDWPCPTVRAITDALTEEDR